jgi:hypothetical protein
VWGLCHCKNSAERNVGIVCGHVMRNCMWTCYAELCVDMLAYAEFVLIAVTHNIVVRKCDSHITWKLIFHFGCIISIKAPYVAPKTSFFVYVLWCSRSSTALELRFARFEASRNWVCLRLIAYEGVHRVGRDDSVGIAARYRLVNGPGIDSRFSAPVQTGPEPNPVTYTVGAGFLSRR